MATHPHSATPGAVRGRPSLLPSTVICETYILAHAGFTVQEMAEHFGVDRSTMYRQRKFAPEFMQSLKEGRGAFVALEAAAAAAHAAETAAAERRELQEAARAAGELFRDIMPPDFETGPARETSVPALFESAETPSQCGSGPEPVPLFDPLGRDGHAEDEEGAPLPLDDPW